MHVSLLILRAAISATLLFFLSFAATVSADADASNQPNQRLSRTNTRAVLSESQLDGVGALVRRSIGRPELRNHDPFLILDEFLLDNNGGFPNHLIVGSSL